MLCYDLPDSQVFAEEVEPTGAVPMELSLERYRYAALPNKFRENSEDKRLQPRVSLKLFPGSQILVQVIFVCSTLENKELIQ
jgi:hypothetical protein